MSVKTRDVETNDMLNSPGLRPNGVLDHVSAYGSTLYTFKLPRARPPWGTPAPASTRCTPLALALRASRSPFCPHWRPLGPIFAIFGRPAGDQKIRRTRPRVARRCQTRSSMSRPKIRRILLPLPPPTIRAGEKSEKSRREAFLGSKMPDFSGFLPI